MGIMKRAYVSSMHALGDAAERLGIAGALERASPRSRTARWIRSLFAIYRIDQMTKLDLPWWTLDAIDRVHRFLRERPAARVFEYGSGASTIWLAKRAGTVTSVEHDADWYPVVQEKLSGFPNAHLLHVPADAVRHSDPSYLSIKPGWKGRSFHDYLHAIDDFPGNFDLIVIDGRARTACLGHVAARLAPGGIILFDNSHRPAYRRAIAAAGMQATRTSGLTACLPYPDETTLLEPQ